MDLRFLLDHIDACGAVATATVEELGWVGREVKTVSPETPALDALKIMADLHVSGLGVEREGKLIGNFSMSDMRCGAIFEGSQ